MKYCWLLLFFALACIVSLGYSREADSSSLPAPTQLSPAANAHLHGFPRRIFFEWSRVNHANGYGIEIDYYGTKWASEANWPHYIDWVKDPNFTFDFVGNQPGAWRVWAMDKNGRPGQVSPWSLFTFGPENAILPDPPSDSPPEFSRLRPAPHTSLPRGKLRELPVFDPVTGEACEWPPPPSQPPGVKMPKAIYTPEPQYTDAARNAKAQGIVTIAVNLGEDGLVKRACVLSATRDDFGLESVKVIRTWRFEPAQKDGKPIPFILPVETSFSLY